MQDAGLQARHRIHQGQGGQLSAGQHIVTQADLFVHKGVNEALVHAFIAPAQQHTAGRGRQLGDARLGQGPSGWTEQDHRQRPQPRLGLVLTNRLQATHQGLHQHDHAGAAAKGPVIHPPIGALGVIAQGPQVQLDQALLKGAAGHAHLLEGPEQLRKQGDDVEAHGACHRTQ